MKNISLFNGDCLQVMDKLIAQGVKVDAIITDPPYGTTACKWDSVIPFDEMWPRLKALRKERTPVVLFGSEPFSSALRMSNIKEFKYDWVWDKGSGGNPLNNKIMPMKTTENISVFGNGKIIYKPIMVDAMPKNIRPQLKVKQKSDFMGKFKNGFIGKSDPKKRYPKNILYFNIRDKECNSLNRLHPTQKPVALLEYLIKTYTNEGDTVLDFTMGSGTTGVACKNLNRDFIGIEFDEKYFTIAQDRIKQTKKPLEITFTGEVNEKT